MTQNESVFSSLSQARRRRTTYNKNSTPVRMVRAVSVVKLLGFLLAAPFVGLQLVALPLAFIRFLDEYRMM